MVLEFTEADTVSGKSPRRTATTVTSNQSAKDITATDDVSDPTNQSEAQEGGSTADTPTGNYSPLARSDPETICHDYLPHPHWTRGATKRSQTVF